MTIESQYKELWDTIKDKKKVSITTNRLLHPRILKAIHKRKWLDLEYKLELEPATASLYHVRQNSILTFILEIKKPRVDLRTLTLEDI